MQEHIATVGSPVSEKHEVVDLLLSLPPSYDSLVNSLQLVQQGLTTPLETGNYLEQNEGMAVDITDCEGVIGSLIYHAMWEHSQRLLLLSE